MASQPALRSLLRETVLPALSDVGFCANRSGDLVRIQGTAISLISLQKHSSKSAFAINLCAHYTFLFSPQTLAESNFSEVSPEACEIRARLTTGDFEVDHWWPAERGSFESLRSLRDRIIIFLDRYLESGEISRVRPSDLTSAYPDVLNPMSRARALLLLSKLNGHLGRSSLACQFAELALAEGGHGRVLSPQFRDIVVRYGSRDG